MLAAHVIICFIALLAGALVLVDLFTGGKRQSNLASVLLVSTVLISLTGFALPAPPGSPSPDPAVIVGIMELAIVVVASVALYFKGLARPWRGIYLVTVVLAIYFNVFVAIVQAFQKIDALRALAPTGKEPPFLIAQLLFLVLFVVIAVSALRRFPARTVTA